MADNGQVKKRVCVTLSLQDHQHLSHLAEETGRTRAGYLRWLLHRHFKGQESAQK